MDELKHEIVRSFRMEMIGTGCYEYLARRYAGRMPKLSERFRKMAESERSHGVMFQKCHTARYGAGIAGGQFWLFMGKLSAVFQGLLPLGVKLKLLSGVEHQAVKQIEAALAAGASSDFHDILRTILPDERKHAALHADWYGG